jgi:hypothetical protein
MSPKCVIGASVLSGVRQDSTFLFQSQCVVIRLTVIIILLLYIYIASLSLHIFSLQIFHIFKMTATIFIKLFGEMY